MLVVIKMEKYYHITSYENLGIISKNGLVPNRGGRTDLLVIKEMLYFYH